MKYLLWLIVIGVLWWVWKKRQTTSSASSEQPPQPAAVERMVRCAHCAVYLPQSDALAAGDQYFCNAAHRQAAAQGRG